MEQNSIASITLEMLKVGKPKTFTVNVLKVEHFTFYRSAIRLKDANGMANSEDPDQTEQSGLGLHCLCSPVCPSTIELLQYREVPSPTGQS